MLIAQHRGWHIVGMQVNASCHQCYYRKEGHLKNVIGISQ